ncbi:hypothetical protein GCM10009840_20960 [Pseudolysinimonas kribbensis]|uniref:Uncharacterized protein n=1 Tax=Pseudolysinimonas kribbensis TaxID=433641 RepID=A0ABQ6K140_9MICO|nr:hypothetical protein GCM10025881_01270 [Pseudolysinimonas kribbensis]
MLETGLILTGVGTYDEDVHFALDRVKPRRWLRTCEVHSMGRHRSRELTDCDSDDRNPGHEDDCDRGAGESED